MTIKLWGYSEPTEPHVLTEENISLIKRLINNKFDILFQRMNMQNDEQDSNFARLHTRLEALESDTTDTERVQVLSNKVKMLQNELKDTRDELKTIRSSLRDRKSVV